MHVKKTFLFTAVLLLSTTGLSAREAVETVSHGKTIDDILWVLVSAVLVFLMQAGFMALETGLSRAKNSINVAIKNITDFIFSIAAFWFVGYGIMFGRTFHGFIGINDFFTSFDVDSWKATFFVFQAVFVGTAATIDSGVIAERAKFSTYLIMSFITSAIIYPIFGHWAWGGLFYEDQAGWLQNLGFLDFAGSSVVHSIGGWVGLSGAMVIGPRIGRFAADGTPQKIPGHNIVFAYLGTFILFFGWFGFNAGSTLGAEFCVANIILNTIISASFGGITAMFLSMFLGKSRLPEPEMIMNGIIAGLVAITAGCAYVSTPSAMVIGIVSGLVVYYGTLLLEKKGIDDVVSAIPVHAFSGVWGTLATGLFIKRSLLAEMGMTRAELVVVQGIGIFACFFWGFGVSLLILKVIKRFVAVRVSADHEKIGLNIAEHGTSSSIVELSNSMRQIIENTEIGGTRKLETEIGTEIGDLTHSFNVMIDRLKEKEEIADRALESLRYISIRDGLTKVFNKKYISEYLDEELKRSWRYESSLSIILFDIDFFKSVNDSYGHQIGDLVLVKTSEIFKSNLREMDVIGRYGGEEFLIVLPETDMQSAFELADRLREKIGEFTWDFDPDRKITISGGVVENLGESSIKMIGRADELLYVAKDKGRNRIEK
ncbi:MAG: ammonium transporter [Spirochaetales bacterium]|nr:ammonium transporter [Spirochaetales bacterium]